MDERLDPLLLSQLRLSIIAYLMVAREAEFNELKEKTGATAGNLSAQLSKLSEAGYVEITKTFRKNYPLTICRITPTGIQAFEDFYSALSSYFDQAKAHIHKEGPH